MSRYVPLMLFLALRAAAFGAPQTPPAATDPSSAAWRQAAEGKLLGAPSAQAESVAVLCEDRSLRAYGKGGALLWRLSLDAKPAPFLSRAPNGSSYFADLDRRLRAVNRSGRELWRRDLDSNLAGPVLVGFDGRIFAVTGKSVSCYSAGGFLKWRRPLDAAPSCPAYPTAAGGLVVASGKGTVYALDAFGSGPEYRSSGVPSAVGEYAGAPLAGLPDGRLVLPNADGSDKALALLPGAPAALAFRSSLLAFLCADGSVGILDPAEGKPRWTAAAGKASAWNLLFDERGVYALGDAGAAGYSLDGSRLWKLELSGASAPCAFSDEGLVYSGGNDWILYAYLAEQRVRKQASSLYGPLPEGNYGLAGLRTLKNPESQYGMDADSVDKKLDEIEASMDASDIGEKEKDFTAYLRMVAASDVEGAPAGRVDAALPHQRSRAARLLGELGSSESTPLLALVLRKDGDSLARSGAASALGAIGSDPEGLALSAFAEAAFSSAHRGDDRVLAAIAAATGELCRFAGPPLSGAGVRILVALAAGDRPSVVRNRAASEMASLAEITVR